MDEQYRFDWSCGQFLLNDVFVALHVENICGDPVCNLHLDSPYSQRVCHRVPAGSVFIAEIGKIPMCDQAFPGQPLNDEWMCSDPESLILILAKDLEDSGDNPNKDLNALTV